MSNVRVRGFSPLFKQPLWHFVDAKNQVVGRLASQIAPILRGKHKPNFTPNYDCGDYVVITNASKVTFTGDKWKNKKYRWHTGFPGGLKEIAAEDLVKKSPEEILRNAIIGMLPKNMLRKNAMAKLRIFPGDAHLHDDKLPKDTPSIVE